MDLFEPEPNTGCWLWTMRAVLGNGYGSMTIDGKLELAHRVSYRVFVGEIPRDLCVLHECDTPACVNPAHLFLGTKGENNTDASRKHRSARGSKHGMAILTESDVREIRRLLEEGALPRIIAPRFGIARRTVSLIKCRDSWGWLA